MDRHELIKQALIEAWQGYIGALEDIAPDMKELIDRKPCGSNLAALSPMAAQIYRQLSSVTYIKIPTGIDFASKTMLADILEESGVNFIIMPDIIETIPTEEDE